MERRSLRVGIDVGGTFTDLVAAETWSGHLNTFKLASTPREPQRAVVDALARLVAQYDAPPAIELLAHATTIATNALLGQIGLELPRVAMVTTAGFRDVIEIGRQNRSELYNLFVGRPRPLVARADRLTVTERIDYRGNVLQALQDAEITRVCDQLRDRDVAAVAICLLHSYVNDTHERQLESALASALPRARIARSSEVDPAYREYERFSTTVVNAALAPIVEAYLERLLRELRDAGIVATLYIMRSDGGLATAERIAGRPAALIESGPASGVVAAAALGRRTGASRLLSFDMGGTTAKAGTIVDGIAAVAREFEAAGATHSGRAVKGSGYPVRFPFVDLAEVSAGGGTIAWLDEGGALRVGPLSAGAEPGPACYGRSTRATVTDANVVLGRLNRQALLGGTFPIDALAAKRAVETLAQPLGMSCEACADGIIQLIDHAMAKVLRIVTVERGLDPREFTLVAFGGGGPLHACAIARDVGIERIIVPAHPGLFSARGLTEADLHAGESVAVLAPANALDRASLEAWYERTVLRARAELLEQGAHPETIAFRREYDARYRGQSFELAIEASPHDIVQRFHAAHRTRYGYDVPDEEVEIVNARLVATGSLSEHECAARAVTPSGARAAERSNVIPSPSTALRINSVLSSRACHPEPFDCAQDKLRNVIPSGVEGRTTRGEGRGTRDEGRSVTEERRTVWIDDGFTDVTVMQREELALDTSIDGPAIIEEYDCTTYVAPGWSLRCEDELLVLEKVSA